MSVVEIIIRLVVVALLASYLFLKHRQRERNWSPEDPAKWTGTAIDATKLIPTVKQVRHDYLAARRSPPPGIWYRRGLAALARRTVGRLAYFRDRKAEDDAQNHT
jgi:hypothetical protein